MLSKGMMGLVGRSSGEGIQTFWPLTWAVVMLQPWPPPMCSRIGVRYGSAWRLQPPWRPLAQRHMVKLKQVNDLAHCKTTTLLLKLVFQKHWPPSVHISSKFSCSRTKIIWKMLEKNTTLGMLMINHDGPMALAGSSHADLLMFRSQFSTISSKSTWETSLWRS